MASPRTRCTAIQQPVFDHGGIALGTEVLSCSKNMVFSPWASLFSRNWIRNLSGEHYMLLAALICGGAAAIPSEFERIGPRILVWLSRWERDSEDTMWKRDRLPDGKTV
jgi:hypothetical protein